MRHLLIASALLLSPALARPAETKLDAKTQEALEMHRKMAELHKKAADCLESGRPMKECHGEAMKDCPMMESGHCPFMGGKGMKKRHMKGMHGRHEGMMMHEGEKPQPKE